MVVIMDADTPDETLIVSASLTVTVALVAPAAVMLTVSASVSVFRSSVMMPVLLPTAAEFRTSPVVEAGASVNPALPVAAMVTLAMLFPEILSAS